MADLKKCCTSIAVVAFGILMILCMYSVNTGTVNAVIDPKYYHQEGQIGSLQKGIQGKTDVLVSGTWSTNLLSIDDVKQRTLTANFISGRLDGSSLDNHKLYFVATNNFTEDAQNPFRTITFNGISTIDNSYIDTFYNVSTTIKFSGDHVISISLEPSQTQYSFGNTPIYGMSVGEFHIP